MSGSPPRGNTAVRCGGGRGARGKSPCRPSDWRRREGSGGLWGMHTELERGRRRIRSVIAGLLWGCTVRRSRRRNRHGGPRDVEATSPVERRTTRTVVGFCARPLPSVRLLCRRLCRADSQLQSQLCSGIDSTNPPSGISVNGFEYSSSDP